MEGLALQIAGQWAVLDSDVSISIEENSPVWGEGNSFSFPFELDVESNRHIIGNSDQLAGDSVYKVLDGKDAVLYISGIPLYYGKLSLENEVGIDEGKIEVTLISGNLTFNEMLENMNCQDVPLIDEIEIGYELTDVLVFFRDQIKDELITFKSSTPPKQFIIHKTWPEEQSVINTTHPYPLRKYCNIRTACKIKDKKEYYILPMGTPASGFCFYILYFLDCLFHKLGILVGKNTLPSMEDMTRLAFVSTACSYTYGREISISNFSLSDFGIYKVKAYRTSPSDYADEETKDQSPLVSLAHIYKIFADSKNFPDTDVSEVIEALKNAFGVVFLHNQKYNTIDLFYVKDILKSDQVNEIYSQVIYCGKVMNNIKGFMLEYTSGGEDDTYYHYNDYSNVELTDDYMYIKKQVMPYNKTLYINTKTGNAYRVKIDKQSDTDASQEMNPSLFQVANFVAASYGDCSSEDTVDKKDISFSPVIMNDVNAKNQKSLYALFVDTEVSYGSGLSKILNNIGDYGDGQICEKNSCKKYIFEKMVLEYNYTGVSKVDGDVNDNSPISDYDPGFMLGVMRGPGSDSRVIDEKENYDGEGNFRYYQTHGFHAFTSDTVDDYGNLFDYNGDESGGVNTGGRFSLKLRAEKPKPGSGFYPIEDPSNQKRGLFDKFWSEYAYWVVNRKIIKMVLRMEIIDIINIDWTKRYKIGEYIGFINKYSYSVSGSGISDVELEMYYL